MHELIKEIRTNMELSQQELADKLHVSFATVNRWENGHCIPNDSIQTALFELCKQYKMSLQELIINKITKITTNVPAGEQIILYHGSKSGIKGDIAPISRDICDFGKGFYMGNIPEQPLTLICDYEQSKFYIVAINLNGLNVLNVEADIHWAMLVALHRKKLTKEVNEVLYDKYSKMLQDVDIVIGYIANDKMFDVLDDFFAENITDTALIECLSALKLGKQYVAITQKACNQISIVQELQLSLLEKLALQETARNNRDLGKALTKIIYKKRRRNGKFFDEILEDC